MYLEKRLQESNMVTTIRFLDVGDASRWIQRYHSTYIDETTRSPANRRARRYGSASDFVARGVVPWRSEWRASIERAVRDAIRDLWNWRRWMATDWTFIAVDGAVVDSGFPHTIHDAIVLPVWLIESFGDAPPPRDSVVTLLHEKIHTLQKRHCPRVFHALYRAWGWRPLRAEEVPPMIARDHRTNPDTPTWWALEHAGATWIPCARLRRGARALAEVDYFLVRVHASRALEWEPLEEVEWYGEYYGHRAMCYHPDENAAVILAEWLAADLSPQRGGGGGGAPREQCEADERLLEVVRAASTG